VSRAPQPLRAELAKYPCDSRICRARMASRGSPRYLRLTGGTIGDVRRARQLLRKQRQPWMAAWLPCEISSRCPQLRTGKPRKGDICLRGHRYHITSCRCSVGKAVKFLDGARSLQRICACTAGHKGDRVDLLFDNLASSLPLYKTQRLRIVAVGSLQRIAAAAISVSITDGSFSSD
jgi:hypothetical protein